MPRAPSIVPEALDQDIYLLLDDFGGRLGRAWRETDADRETVIRNLLAGEVQQSGLHHRIQHR